MAVSHTKVVSNELKVGGEDNQGHWVHNMGHIDEPECRGRHLQRRHLQMRPLPWQICPQMQEHPKCPVCQSKQVWKTTRDVSQWYLANSKQWNCTNTPDEPKINQGQNAKLKKNVSMANTLCDCPDSVDESGKTRPLRDVTDMMDDNECCLFTPTEPFYWPKGMRGWDGEVIFKTMMLKVLGGVAEGTGNNPPTIHPR